MGTEHLLLGILETGPNTAARMLVSQGVSLSALSTRLHIEASSEMYEPDSPRPHTSKALALAEKEALRGGSRLVSTGHLVLGILREGDNVGSKVLNGFGTTLDLLRVHQSATVEPDNDTDPRSEHAAPGDTPSAPRSLRGVLWRALAPILAVAVFLTLVLGGAAWASIVAAWSGSSASDLAGARWVSGWLVFVTLVLATCCVTHTAGLRRLFSKRNREALAEEFFGIDFVDDPAIDSVDRVDYSLQAIVVDTRMGIVRWARRVAGWSVLTLGACVWVFVSTGLQAVIGWFATSAAVLLLLSILVWRKCRGFGVHAFSYPTRSDRVAPNVAKGLNAGLAGFAFVVLTIPVLSLLVSLLAQSTWRPDIRHGSSGLVLRVLEEVALVIADDPVLAAGTLFVLPLLLVVLVHRVTRLSAAVDVAEWRISEDLPPALYLRTWESDRIPVTRRPRTGLLETISPSRRSTFTEALGSNLSLVAPVALVGQPGTERQRGVGSIWSSDERWQHLVEEFAEQSLVTVFTASEVPPDSGFSWEIELVGSGRTTGRVVIVFPPGYDFERSLEPGGYLDVATQHPIFHGIREARPITKTLLMARGRDGKWWCYDASIPDDASYAHCFISLLFDDYVSDWENGALGETDFPSTLHTQRFVATLAGSNVAKMMWVVYPPIRAVMVLVRELFFR